MSHAPMRHSARATRRAFLAGAAALGAVGAFAGARAAPSRLRWTERRDLYPQGVASGDPEPHTVILWTRRAPVASSEGIGLTCEVSEDEAFTRVVAVAPALARQDYDGTVRVLAGGLKPATVYWYRFTDATGAGSRVGRTITAPGVDADRDVRFTFVSCQTINEGAQNAYRRMIFEDERAAPHERLDFVLHLGDFIYEVVSYPEDQPKRYDRVIRDVFRYEHGEKVGKFHVPTTLDDYRTAYRAYLQDVDIQDARARWPFVCIWDNHEFSWRGFQSFQKFGADTRAAQTVRVAANQAWFEFQPARVRKPDGEGLEAFVAPKVIDTPITTFDEHGLGTEPNNLKAIGSLSIHRALRFGRHVDLILTDHHAYRSDDVMDGPLAAPFRSDDHGGLFPEEIAEALDAGRTANGGKPPASFRYGDKDLPNPRRDGPAQTKLGAEQKRWFLDRLTASTATWKVWGHSNGTLPKRTDPQNLPPELVGPWPGAGYATFGGDYPTERAEIFSAAAKAGVSGFAIVAGDRHSFWAGLTGAREQAEPVAVEFITGSISSPGMVESLEYSVEADYPLAPLFLHEPKPGVGRKPMVNMLLRHGVRSCLEYARTGDAEAARRLSNPELSSKLSFVDMAGHGYARVHVSAKAIDTEFVCIPRPLERSASADGGPLRYRVAHRAELWSAGQRPRLEQRVISGDPDLAI